MLIPFVSLALAYRERDVIFASVSSDWRVGLRIAGIGVALFLAGSAPSSPNVWLSLRITSVVSMWIGGFAAFYGRKALRVGLFPILFMAFMIPPPEAVLNGAVAILKQGSMEAVAILFKLTGTPLHREGLYYLCLR